MTLTTDVGWLANMDDDGARPTADYVMRYAARAFGVPVSAFTSSDRSHPVVWYRQVAMVAVMEVTGDATPRVGRLFDRDHSTVVHARERCRKVERLGRSLDRLVTACRRQWAIDNGLPDPGPADARAGGVTLPEDFAEKLGGREVGRLDRTDEGDRWTCECGASETIPPAVDSERLASLGLYFHRKGHA